MNGPCLCGDPYCSSCGNPSLAALEEWSENFTNKLINANIDEYEAKFLEDAIFPLLKNFRENIKPIIDEASRSYGEQIDYLKNALEDLKGREA